MDFLPYVSWISSQPGAEEKGELAQMSSVSCFTMIRCMWIGVKGKKLLLLIC